MSEIYIVSCTKTEGGNWESYGHKFEYEDESYLEMQIKKYCFNNCFVSIRLSDGREWDIYNGFRNKPAPSPTVEISLEDAKMIDSNLSNMPKVNYPVKSHSHTRLCEAISKAESKEPDTLEACLKRDEELFRKSLEGMSPVSDMKTLNTPALPIQDQVNELRKEMAGLNHSMRNVIEDINHKIIPYMGSNISDISQLKDTISQLQSVIEGMKPNLTDQVRGSIKIDENHPLYTKLPRE